MPWARFASRLHVALGRSDLRVALLEVVGLRAELALDACQRVAAAIGERFSAGEQFVGCGPLLEHLGARRRLHRSLVRRGFQPRSLDQRRRFDLCVVDRPARDARCLGRISEYAPASIAVTAAIARPARTAINMMPA